MPPRYSRIILVAFLLLPGMLSATPVVVAQDDNQPANDIVLLLDNSGSMKRNDPHRALQGAVKQFVQMLPPDTRLAVQIFDTYVKSVMPLTAVAGSSTADLGKALEQLDYRGIHTDTASAVEHAIHALKSTGRGAAAKSIILLTDGIIDTGDGKRDQAYTTWLREQLSADASALRIALYSIAVGDNADFPMLHALAQKTGGEYFRVDQVDNVRSALDSIRKAISKRPLPSLAAAPAVPVPVPPPVQGAQSETTVAAPAEPPRPPESPTQVQALPREVSEPVTDEPVEPSSSRLPIVVILLSILALILVLWVRRIEKAAVVPVTPSPSASMPEAYLVQLDDSLADKRHFLARPFIWIGRTPRSLNDGEDQIVLDGNTVSREHASIEYKQHGFWVTDQGSINGTFINGARLSGEWRLKDGDVIRIADIELRFELPMMVISAETVVVMPPEESAEGTAKSAWSSVRLPTRDEVESTLKDYFTPKKES